MKRNIINLFIAVASVFLYSCATEEMITIDPSFEVSFQREGRTYALAGEQLQVILTGEAQFCTLYDGTEGHIYGDSAALGTDFNTADSLTVTYGTAGTYQMTVIFTSSGKWGSEVKREIKTLPIEVKDNRNTMTSFMIKNVLGSFKPNNTIEVALPNSVTNFNFSPTFVTNSSAATVTVNGVIQTSGSTVNDFSSPVIYVVKSATGEENQYTVNITSYEASSEKNVTKFSLANDKTYGFGEVAEIDNTNHIINLPVNYGTNVNKVKVTLETSYGSIAYFNSSTSVYPDRTYTNISGTLTDPLQTIRVVAQDSSSVTYQFTTTLLDPVTSFKFTGLTPNPVGTIDTVNKTITVNVLPGTDVSALVAEWEGTLGTVKIGTVTQVNGTTANNFSSPVQYTFYKGTKAGDKYTVTVNVIQ